MLDVLHSMADERMLPPLTAISAGEGQALIFDVGQAQRREEETQSLILFRDLLATHSAKRVFLSHVRVSSEFGDLENLSG